jgi:hypothetical protein
MVKSMKVRAYLFGIMMVTTTLPLGAGERLTMKASPSISFAPANLIVRTMIEADVQNRAVEVIADSANFYRSSEIQLEGDKAPRTSTFEFRSLPPGVYEVKVMLIGADGQQRALARQQVNVISSGAGE